MTDKPEDIAIEFRRQLAENGLGGAALEKMYLILATCEDLGRCSGACDMLEALAPFLTPGSIAIGVALRDKLRAEGEARLEKQGAIAIAAEENREGPEN